LLCFHNLLQVFILNGLVSHFSQYVVTANAPIAVARCNADPSGLPEQKKANAEKRSRFCDTGISRLSGNDSKGFSLENADGLAHFFTTVTIRYRSALVKQNLRREEFSEFGDTEPVDEAGG